MLVTPYEIDRNHPIGRNVLACIVMDGVRGDIVKFTGFTNNGATKGIGRNGRKLGFVTDDYLSITDRPGLNRLSNSGFTVVEQFSLNTTAADGQLSGRIVDAAAAFHVWYSRARTNGIYRLSVQDQANNQYPNWNTPTSSLSTNTVHTIAAGWGKNNLNATDCSIALDGDFPTLSYSAGGSGYTSAFTLNTTTNDADFGRQSISVPNKYLDGDYYFWALIYGRLPDHQLVGLTNRLDAPFQIFRQRRKRAWISVPAVGGPALPEGGLSLLGVGI